MGELISEKIVFNIGIVRLSIFYTGGGELGIRNAAKALIIRNNKILVNKNKNSLGDMCYGLPMGAIYYDLPGGGQNQYETLEEAVKRECLEETGYSVNIDRLAAIYEEISTNDRLRLEYERYAHKVYFIFVCHLENDSIMPLTERDLDMLESEWIEIDNMKNIPLYPRLITVKLKTILKSKSILYLGSERIK